MDWAFVDPKTPIQQGVKFCVCVKELLPWVMMPLQVVYVNESKVAKNRVASFGFGSGTLHGHLLVSTFPPFLLLFFSSVLFSCPCGTLRGGLTEHIKFFTQYSNV